MLPPELIWLCTTLPTIAFLCCFKSKKSKNGYQGNNRTTKPRSERPVNDREPEGGKPGSVVVEILLPKSQESNVTEGDSGKFLRPRTLITTTASPSSRSGHSEFARPQFQSCEDHKTNVTKNNPKRVDPKPEESPEKFENWPPNTDQGASRIGSLTTTVPDDDSADTLFEMRQMPSISR